MYPEFEADDLNAVLEVKQPVSTKGVRAQQKERTRSVLAAWAIQPAKEIV
jgi:hypothetical protein